MFKLSAAVLVFLVLQASDAVRDLPKMQQALQELQARYAAAVELVGERDEQLEELANDLEDVKQMYRQQIETLLAQQQ
jgi:L-lactate utilization protein LutB